MRRGAWPKLGALLVLTIAVLWGLDRAYPLPMPDQGARFASLITAADGTPLRRFADAQGVWRYPVEADKVAPRYVQALLTYEDQHFYRHTGINPFSLLRAGWQRLRHGRIVSGGSTLSMQVARILEPHERSLWGKFRQLARSLQLEWHYDKDAILGLYLNYAPFGGPLEGVQAASLSYLGKSADSLSHAEAALLAVLPQAPSRLRPDRYPEAARAARDKVLERLAERGVWDRATVEAAKAEPVPARWHGQPTHAPLLAERLRRTHAEARLVRSTLDAELQARLENMLKRAQNRWPAKSSAAILVIDNQSLEVRAYLGSGDFLDNERFGQIDMVTARRSPGSTLKPFLYGMALEEGLVHSESLLVDAPRDFGAYRPGNFDDGYSGPVSVSEALRRSLNVPAVDLLERLGPGYFDARLRQGGLSLDYPPGAGPSLAMILGGAAVSLEELVGAYVSLARNGQAGRPRFTQDEPVRERSMLAPGAAFIVRDILRHQVPPPAARGMGRGIAWKTGTSYGYRDAWAVGVDERHTVGIWVGRPDGTSVPGFYGAATAVPLLFNAFAALPSRQRAAAAVPPATVRRERICWPLGTAKAGQAADLCLQEREAWILDGMIPASLPDRDDARALSNPLTVTVNASTGLRLSPGCEVEKRATRRIALWPAAVQAFLPEALRRPSRLPDWDPACVPPRDDGLAQLLITQPLPNSLLRRHRGESGLPSLELRAQGGRERLYWFNDGKLIGESAPDAALVFRPERAGRHWLAVLDAKGGSDGLSYTIQGNELRSPQGR